MKLSIIMPNYNYAPYVEKAILSLFQNAPKKNFELIVVDDASTDESLKILNRLEKRFSSMHLFCHEKNLGALETIQTGVSHSKGEYLHFFASDDLYLPNALNEMLEFIHIFPEIPFFCSDSCFFSKTFETKKLIECSHFRYFSKKQLSKLFRHTDFWIRGQTVIVKKDIYKKFCLRKELHFVSDWVLNHEIALEEGVGYIPKALVAARIHANSYVENASLQEKRQVWLNLLELFEKKELKKELYQTGILRWLGLRSIYKDLLFNFKFWKYLFPICCKVIEAKIALAFKFNRDKFWLEKIIKC